MRHWLKILVLVLALLSQVAATCSTGGESSNLGDTPPARSGY
jgi:hypothetical protein